MAPVVVAVVALLRLPFVSGLKFPPPPVPGSGSGSGPASLVGCSVGRRVGLGVGGGVGSPFLHCEYHLLCSKHCSPAEQHVAPFQVSPPHWPHSPEQSEPPSPPPAV